MLWIKPARFDTDQDWMDAERAALSKGAELVLQRELPEYRNFRVTTLSLQRDVGQKTLNTTMPSGFAVIIILGTRLKIFRLAHEIGPINVGEEDLDAVGSLDSQTCGERGLEFAHAGEFGRVLKERISWEQVGTMCHVFHQKDRQDLEAKLHVVRKISQRRVDE